MSTQKPFGQLGDLIALHTIADRAGARCSRRHARRPRGDQYGLRRPNGSYRSACRSSLPLVTQNGPEQRWGHLSRGRPASLAKAVSRLWAVHFGGSGVPSLTPQAVVCSPVKMSQLRQTMRRRRVFAIRRPLPRLLLTLFPDLLPPVPRWRGRSPQSPAEHQ